MDITKKPMNGEELDKVSGGSDSGFFMTVDDCNGSYLALRSQPCWDKSNEIAQLWPTAMFTPMARRRTAPARTARLARTGGSNTTASVAGRTPASCIDRSRTGEVLCAPRFARNTENLPL